jgi:hypothetical protein
MRKIPLLLLALMFTQTAQAFEQDKARHAQAGLMISMYTQGISGPENSAMKYAGLAAGCIAGLAKEVYDSTGRGKTESADFLYTCGGALIGNYFSNSAVVYPDSNGTIYFGISKAF